MNRLHTRVSKILDRTMTLEEILSGSKSAPFVIPELHEYVKELLAYSPGLKFAHKRDNELWVYLEDNPYVLGYIGWADYQEWVSGEKKYMVASRNICNEKYASYNDQHSMHTSINLKTILSKAKKAMRPINPIEIAEMEVRSIEDKFKRGVSDKSNIADNLWSNIRFDDEDALKRELRNIIRSDYKFAQPELKHKLQECFKAMDVSKEAKAKTLHVHFVRAYDKYGDGELHFEVIDVNNLQTTTPQVVKEIKRYTEAEMPEDILGKVSVLNITDVDEYVEDVGYNTGDGMFYVVK
jgi:hypothetical protein